MKQFSLSEAVDHLFGIKVSHYPELRNVLNKMVKAKIIQRALNEDAWDKHICCTEDKLPIIHNTVLLHAILVTTKRVKDALTQEAARIECAKTARALFALPFMRDVVGLNENTNAFLAMMEEGAPLSETALPNPFRLLPQVVLDSRHAALIEASLLCETSSPLHIMMSAYLARDYATAYEIAKTSTFEATQGKELQQRIIKKYEGSQRAEKILREFI